jgi:hypothetical protein
MPGNQNAKLAALTGDPLHTLTDKQKIFVDCLMRGNTQTMAARTAGYGQPAIDANRLMKSPRIKGALTHMQKKYEKASQMSRKKVMDGMLEAIDMAKVQSEPGVMVAGWREIGRMCGYYAAEKKIIDINITAKRAVDKLETMSDSELLEMIDTDSEAIEGEFAEVLEG